MDLDAVPFWTTGVKQVPCLETAQAGTMHNMAEQLNRKTYVKINHRGSLSCHFGPKF